MYFLIQFIPMVKKSVQILLCPKINAFNFGITKSQKCITYALTYQLYYQNAGLPDEREVHQKLHKKNNIHSCVKLVKFY